MSLTCQCPAATAIPDVPNVICAQTFGQIQRLHWCVCARRTEPATHLLFPVVPVHKQAKLKTCIVGNKVGGRRWFQNCCYPLHQCPGRFRRRCPFVRRRKRWFGRRSRGFGRQPCSIRGRFACRTSVRYQGVERIDVRKQRTQFGRVPVWRKRKHRSNQGWNRWYNILSYSRKRIFVGDKIHGNYDAKDNNPISWQYPANYSDDLAIVTPDDFNPLTDLINGGSQS